MTSIGASITNKLEGKESYSVTSKLKKSEKQDCIVKYYPMVPSYLKVWPYDVMLVYCPSDNENIKLYLQNLSSVKLEGKHRIRAVLFDDPKINHSSHSNLFLDTLNNSSYIFIYVTRHFCNNPNGWVHFSRQKWIKDSIYSRKCIVVKFCTERLPMGLNSLASLNYAETFGSHMIQICQLLEPLVQSRIKNEIACNKKIWEWIQRNILEREVSTGGARNSDTETSCDRNDGERKTQIVRPQVQSLPHSLSSQNYNSLQSSDSGAGYTLPSYSSGDFDSIESFGNNVSTGYWTDDFEAADSVTEAAEVHHHYHRNNVTINIYRDVQEMPDDSGLSWKKKTEYKKTPFSNQSPGCGNNTTEEEGRSFEKCLYKMEGDETKNSLSSELISPRNSLPEVKSGSGNDVPNSRKTENFKKVPKKDETGSGSIGHNQKSISVHPNKKSNSTEEKVSQTGVLVSVCRPVSRTNNEKSQLADNKTHESEMSKQTFIGRKETDSNLNRIIGNFLPDNKAKSATRYDYSNGTEFPETQEVKYEDAFTTNNLSDLSDSDEEIVNTF